MYRSIIGPSWESLTIVFCFQVEKEVQEIHLKIVEVAGGKVKGLQKAVDEIVKKIDKVHAEITRLNVAIKTSQR